jgi:vancomycin resistance protein VanJ
MTAMDESGSAKNAGWRRITAAFTAVCWAYPAVLLGIWILMFFAADRWWVATVLLYSPRWVWGLGLVPMVAWAAVRGGRKRIWAVAAAAFVWLFLLMRLTVSLPAGGNAAPGEYDLRIVTLNLHRRASDPAAFAELIRRERPHVAVMQDWSENHRQDLFPPGEWHTRRNGSMFLASRFPIRETENLALDRLRGDPATTVYDDRAGIAVRYRLDTPAGPLHLFNVHFTSPHEGFDRLMEHGPAAAGGFIQTNSGWRRTESEVIRRRAESVPAGEPVIVAGDFNTPVESPIYREMWNEYENAFGEAGNGFGLTYRVRRTQVRIDHVLVNQRLRPLRCRVGPTTGSPHRPVIADLRLLARR